MESIAKIVDDNFATEMHCPGGCSMEILAVIRDRFRAALPEYSKVEVTLFFNVVTLTVWVSHVGSFTRMCKVTS